MGVPRVPTEVEALYIYKYPNPRARADVISLGRDLDILERINSALPKPNLELFTCFPDLPKELRLKIWRGALPGGFHGKRMIIVGCSYKDCVWKGTGSGWIYEPKSEFKLYLEESLNRNCRALCYDTFDVGMTLACRESREVYLREYQSMFPVNRMCKSGKDLGDESIMRFDSKSDVFCFKQFSTDILDAFMEFGNMFEAAQREYSVLAVINILAVDLLSHAVRQRGVLAGGLAHFHNINQVITVLDAESRTVGEASQFEYAIPFGDSQEVMDTVWKNIELSEMETVAEYKKQGRANPPKFLLLVDGIVHEKPEKN